MAGRKERRGLQHHRGIENRMTRSLDKLAKYEEFLQDVIPQIRADVKEGLTGAEIQEKYQRELVAKQVSLALTEKDSAKAFKLIQDIRDRIEGKATQKVETTHRLENMDEDQLDALILSKAGSVAEDSSDEEVH